MVDKDKNLIGAGYPFYTTKIKIVTKTPTHDYITEIPVSQIKMWDYSEIGGVISLTLYLNGDVEFKLERPEAKELYELLNQQFYTIGTVVYTLK